MPEIKSDIEHQQPSDTITAKPKANPLSYAPFWVALGTSLANVPYIDHYKHATAFPIAYTIALALLFVYLISMQAVVLRRSVNTGWSVAWLVMAVGFCVGSGYGGAMEGMCEAWEDAKFGPVCVVSFSGVFVLVSAVMTFFIKDTIC